VRYEQRPCEDAPEEPNLAYVSYTSGFERDSRKEWRWTPITCSASVTGPELCARWDPIRWCCISPLMLRCVNVLGVVVGCLNGSRLLMMRAGVATLREPGRDVLQTKSEHAVADPGLFDQMVNEELESLSGLERLWCREPCVVGRYQM